MERIVRNVKTNNRKRMLIILNGADGKHDMALMAEIVAFLDGSLQ